MFAGLATVASWPRMPRLLTRWICENSDCSMREYELGTIEWCRLR